MVDGNIKSNSRARNQGKRKAGPQAGPQAGTEKSRTPVNPGGNQTPAPTPGNQDILDDLDVNLPPLPGDEIYTDEAVTVKTETAPQPSIDEKGAAWRLNPQARKLAKKEAQQTAIILLTLLDGLAGMFYGPAASMNDYERDMMEAPLERILMRLDIVSSDAISKWSDPILFLMGLTAWMSRVNRERQEAPEKEETPAPAPAPAPVKAAPNNGRPANNPPPGDIILTEQLTAPKNIRDQIGGDRIE